MVVKTIGKLIYLAFSNIREIELHPEPSRYLVLLLPETPAWLGYREFVCELTFSFSDNPEFHCSDCNEVVAITWNCIGVLVNLTQLYQDGRKLVGSVE